MIKFREALRLFRRLNAMKNVIVVGAGAAGLMAAYAAAKNGNTVTVLERNEKAGKKIYITGKGRCNVTNNVPPEEFFENVVRNAKFLKKSIYSFSSIFWFYQKTSHTEIHSSPNFILGLNHTNHVYSFLLGFLLQ